MSALSLSGILKRLCQSRYDYLIADNLVRPHFCLRYTTHKSICGVRRNEKNRKSFKKVSRFVSFSGLTIFVFAWSGRSLSHLNWKFGERDSWKKWKFDSHSTKADSRRYLNKQRKIWAVRRSDGALEVYPLSLKCLRAIYVERRMAFSTLCWFYDWRIIMGALRAGMSLLFHLFGFRH